MSWHSSVKRWSGVNWIEALTRVKYTPYNTFVLPPRPGDSNWCSLSELWGPRYLTIKNRPPRAMPPGIPKRPRPQQHWGDRHPYGRRTHPWLIRHSPVELFIRQSWWTPQARAPQRCRHWHQNKIPRWHPEGLQLSKKSPLTWGKANLSYEDEIWPTGVFGSQP